MSYITNWHELLELNILICTAYPYAMAHLHKRKTDRAYSKGFLNKGLGTNGRNRKQSVLQKRRKKKKEQDSKQNDESKIWKGSVFKWQQLLTSCAAHQDDAKTSHEHNVQRNTSKREREDGSQKNKPTYPASCQTDPLLSHVIEAAQKRGSGSSEQKKKNRKNSWWGTEICSIEPNIRPQPMVAAVQVRQQGRYLPSSCNLTIIRFIHSMQHSRLESVTERLLWREKKHTRQLTAIESQIVWTQL